MSASDAGFVKVYRTILGHPAFRNDAEAMAFAWMVIRASWKPARVRYKDRTIQLKRGQLAMSVRDMATAMDRDKAWVERLWKRLKAETMIETATDAGVSVVTICKYESFQGERTSREDASETPNETDARQAQDTEQRREEDKNKKKDTSLEFEGRTIRLTRRDFATWERAYSAIPDLRAELVSLDDWISEQPDEVRAKWFFRVSGALKNRHQENLRQSRESSVPIC